MLNLEHYNMKKYKIIFTNDQIRPALVKEWKGKEITLKELEKVIFRFNQVVFNGDTIEVYNDYRE